MGFMRYEKSVLEACEELHMHQTGASDVLDDSGVAARIAYLQMRLDNWMPSPHHSLAYDEAVRHLIRITLAEQHPHCDEEVAS